MIVLAVDPSFNRLDDGSWLVKWSAADSPCTDVGDCKAGPLPGALVPLLLVRGVTGSKVPLR